MKILSSTKIKLSLLLLLTTSFSFAQKIPITIEKSKQSFKKVAEGEIVTLTYFINYEESENLTMLPPEVDCSCTSVELNDNVIYPNKRNELKVIFNTAQKIGYQEREVKLIFISAINGEKFAQKIIL